MYVCVCASLFQSCTDRPMVTMVTSRRDIDNWETLFCQSVFHVLTDIENSIHLTHQDTFTCFLSPFSFPASLSSPLFLFPPHTHTHTHTHTMLDSIKGVRDYGMPDTRHTSLKGNLYIKFKIQFPESGFLPTEEERDVSTHTHTV